MRGLRVGHPLVALVLVAAAVAAALLGAWWAAGSGGPSASPSPAAGTPTASPSPEPTASSPEPTATESPTPTIGPSPSPTAAGLAATRHFFVIVLENKEADQIVGNPQAPYFNQLAARYGLATRYGGVTHPSEPNYLALWSGSTQGVTDDAVHDLSARTVADQLEAAGRTWHVFAEHVPSGCYRGAVARDGRDGPGTYARKHEPAISFVAVSRNPRRCAHISDFTSFAPAAANLQLIVPDMCHDMHDCSIATGDRWLRSFVPRILGSAAWRDGGVLVITFDEGGVRNQVATLVIRPGMRPGMRSGIAHDHYGLLRTIEVAFGLPCLARSCSTAPMTEFFGP